MTEPRTIEETYAAAVTSADLRVEADRRSDADVLIAVGWSTSRIGAALMRLHTEFDSTARSHGKPTETEFRLLMGQLKSLTSVREQVALQASKWGAEQPEHLALVVVWWWLDKICPKCCGRKFEPIKDTPALSARHCKACRGSGESQLPHGEAGKRIARWLEECVERAQASIKKRLHTAQECG